MNRLVLISLIWVLVGWSARAQNQDNLNNHTYYYTVGEVTSEEQLHEAQQSFEDLKFVTKVKLNYKPEKSGKAQFIIYVSEPKRTSESQKMFEPTELKKIIINHNLFPTDLKIEDY